MVAIKDMKEMPSCCTNCPFDALNKCLLTGQLIKGNRLVNGEDKRLDDCPLVEIEERKIEKLEQIKRIVKAPMGGKHMKYNKIVEVLEQE